MRGDFLDEARRFEDIDRAVLDKIRQQCPTCGGSGMDDNPPSNVCIECHGDGKVSPIDAEYPE